MKTDRSKIYRALLLLGAASPCVLVACGPMMSAPASPPMPPLSQSEQGHGLNAGAILDGERSAQAVGGYQFWYRLPSGTDGRHEGGLVAQAGFPSIFTAGGYYRRSLIKTERAFLGGQVAGGLAWVAASVPTAVKVGDKIWLTTQPSINKAAIEILRVPVGMSWETSETGRLDVELGITFWNKSFRNPGLPNVAESIAHGKGYGPILSIAYAQHLGEVKPPAPAPAGPPSPAPQPAEPSSPAPQE